MSILNVHRSNNFKFSPSATPTYTVDYFLVRKALQYSLHDIISFKEAITSRLDLLPDPPTDAENEILSTLDELRVAAFNAYDELIILSSSQLLTLAYTTTKLGSYEGEFNQLVDEIEALLPGITVPVRTELQSLLDKMVDTTKQHHYNVKVLLTP